jgi:hypothetical protein
MLNIEIRQARKRHVFTFLMFDIILLPILGQYLHLTERELFHFGVARA